MKTPTPEQVSNDTVAMFKAMAKEGGGPAYPQQIQYGTGEKGEPFVWFSMGLTKREKFAAMMLQGMLSIRNVVFSEDAVNEAVSWADALIERLKQ